METEAFEKRKNDQRRYGKKWLWCCAGLTATFIFFCCSIPLMAMIGMGIVSANEVTETETQSLSIDNVDGAINLEVTNPVGSTSITSDRNADKIEVEIVRRANAFTKDDARNLLENIEVDVRSEDDGFVIDVEPSDHDGFLWFSSPKVDLRITVPDDEAYNLTVENNVGGLVVRDLNIADRMELSNDVGGIEYVGAIGPEGEYQITNNVGGITLDVSQDSRFNLDATADVGGIDLSLGRAWRETDHQKDSPGESYRGTYGDDDGAATLTITTDVGGIEISD